jgi:hypothetical protein
MPIESTSRRGAHLVTRVGRWLSVRMPFVWRTRMLFWIALGVGATAVGVGYGLLIDVEPTRLPGLGSLQTWLTVTTLLSYGLIFLVVVDTVRRTRPVVRSTHHLRVASCVAVVVFIVSMPPIAFVSTLAPRVAGLESPEAMAIHEKNRFWHCWTDSDALRAAVEPYRMVLEGTAQKYVGISSAFVSSDRCRVGDQREAYSLWGYGAPIIPRLQHVAAAQRYVLGDHTAYDDFTASDALVISLLAGLLAGAFSSGFAPDVLSLLRARWSLHLRLVRRRGGALDRALAIRSPILWSSRVHNAPVSMMIPPATLSLMAILSSPDWVLGAGLGALSVVCLFLSFRSQETVRFALLPWRGELGVFLIHAAVAATAALVSCALAHALDGTTGTLSTNYPGNAIGILLGAVFMAAALQAARNVSALGVCAIIIVVVSIAAGLGLGVGTLSGQKEDFVISMALIGSAIVAATTARICVRYEMRPSFRRHTLGAALFVGPMPALVWMILMTPRDADFTPFRGFVSLALGVAFVAVALYATRNPRHALSYTAR